MVAIAAVAVVAVTAIPVVAAAGTTAAGAAAAGGAAASTTGAVTVSATVASTATEVAATLVVTGPAGWVILGADAKLDMPYSVTLDCWKGLLRDPSRLPSKGRLLRDIVVDPRIKQIFNVGTCICSSPTGDIKLPQLMLTNIWDETFDIQYVVMPDNQLAAHAVKQA